jgi:exodeoxyribonuclease-5
MTEYDEEQERTDLLAEEEEFQPAPSGLVLTEEQDAAVKQAVEWLETYKASPSTTIKQFRIAGLAGTGKTTIMKEIRRTVDNYLDLEAAPCSFTGKAASVMRKKGLGDATTIHSRMYKPEVDDKGKVTWKRKPFVEQDYWLVDESSMVSTDLYRDMCAFNKPMLFVGDHGQLEPVGENPNLMRNADVVLEKIHRQAEGNPILKLALNVRLGGGVSFPVIPCPDCLRLASSWTWQQYWNKSDLVDTQIICAFNKSRHKINRECRQALGFYDKLKVGEKVICLQNNHDVGMFNGQMFYVQEITHDEPLHFRVNLVDDLGRTFNRVKMFKEIFGGGVEVEEARQRVRDEDMCFFDYGYCITCHKSQGSEWKNIIVVEQPWAEKYFEIARWRYTAITRAAERLVYCK